MSAEVIHLPVAPTRSCEHCVHYRGSEHETRCALYDVEILSEVVAAKDCEGFES